MTYDTKREHNPRTTRMDQEASFESDDAKRPSILGFWPDVICIVEYQSAIIMEQSHAQVTKMLILY